VKKLAAGVAIALAVAATGAHAADPAESVYIQWGINEDGRGHVLANPMPDGSWGSMTWQACAPDGTCSSVAPSRDDSCKVIADTHYWAKCPGTGARIAPRYAGWYLRVAEAHEGNDIVFAERAYTRPEDIPAMRTSAITAVTTVGRIQPGRGPNRRC
jgi:hypothetical protein